MSRLVWAPRSVRHPILVVVLESMTTAERCQVRHMLDRAALWRRFVVREG